MKRTAIVFALSSELMPTARSLGAPSSRLKEPQIILDNKKVALVKSGIGRERAIKAAEKVISEFHPEIIISAGFCGALVENLKVGDIVISDFDDGKIFCSPRPLFDYKDKLAAHREHGALVVDMESEGVRIIAGRYDIPFVAIKAVSDGLKDDIPNSLFALKSLWRFLRFKRSMDIASKRLSEFLSGYVTEKYA